MTSSVTAPLEVQFGQMPSLNQMSLDELGRRLGHHAAVQPEHLSLDIAEQEVQAAINAAGNLLPSDLPAPPIYAKVNPADAPILTLGADLEDHAADAGRGPRRHAARAEDLAAARRRPGQHQRRPAAGGAHPGRHPQARRLRPQHRRSAHHDRQRQRQHAQGQFRRPACAPTRSTPTTRSATPPTTTIAGRRLQERRAGAAVRRRRRRRRRARTPSSAPG